MNCPCPETARYGRFSRRIHSRASAERHPVSGTIELTARCNLKCAHCYINLPAGDREARESELGTHRILDIIDEIADAGCLWLLLTGGEPLLRPDFPEVYIHAKKRGLLVTLFTNGTLVTPEIADLLARWRPFSVEITLCGHTRETCERVTGVPGSHGRSLRGIRLLRERGVPLKLKSTILSLNRHELRAMRRFAEEELGLSFRFDAMINPRLSCSPEPLAVRLDPEEVVALDLGDARRRAELTRFARGTVRPEGGPGGGDDLFHCGGGVSAFSIDSAGQLRICGFYPGGAWDLRKGSFREGWERPLADLRRAKSTRRTRCADCGIREVCGMCPANAVLENGDAETPVDFLCRTAHQRVRALGLEVPRHGDCPYCSGSGSGRKHAPSRETLPEPVASAG